MTADITKKNEFPQFRLEEANRVVKNTQSSAHRERSVPIPKEDKICSKDSSNSERRCSRARFIDHIETCKKNGHDPSCYEYDEIKCQVICNYCKKSRVRYDNMVNHIGTKKHMDNMKEYKKSYMRQSSMVSLIQQDKTLPFVPDNVHTLRATVLREFLKAGITTNKIDEISPWLSMVCNTTIPGVQHLKTHYLKILREQEIDTIRAEIADKYIRVSFDETTIIKVNFCVVIGFVMDGKMEQRIVSLHQFDKSPKELDHHHLSSWIIHAIETKLNHPKHLISVFTRDGVQINELAMTRLIGGHQIRKDGVTVFVPAQYERAIDIKCMSHTIDRCGADFTSNGIKQNRIEGKELKDFFNHLNGYFSNISKTANFDWARDMNISMKSVSATRWWSREEFWEFIYPYFEPSNTSGRLTLGQWIQKQFNETECPGQHLKYLNDFFVSGGSSLAILKLQIAIVIDVTRCLRIATFSLEGDYVLAPQTYSILKRCQSDFETHFESMTYRNVTKEIDSLVESNMLPPSVNTVNATTLKNQWIVYCKSIAQPCYDYFKDYVLGHPAIKYFVAAQIIDPFYVKENNNELNGTSVESILKVFSLFLSDEDIKDLLSEFSDYKYISECVRNVVIDAKLRGDYIEQFWANNLRTNQLPTWTKFAHRLFLMQPTSACVERAFSLLIYMYGDQQYASLMDIIEIQLMLRFNRSKTWGNDIALGI
jgi:hypothetical protein